MALLRHAIRDDVLVVERRGFLFPWRWYFLRSEEDALTVLKNERSKAHWLMKRARVLIPKQEKALKDKKDALRKYSETSGKPHGQVWRDSFQLRRRPVRLIEDSPRPRKKQEGNDRSKRKQRPVPIATLSTPFNND